MAAAAPSNVQLDATEVALIIGEDDGEMSVRVVAGNEVSDDAEDLPAAAEIVLALAMRLLKDPDFHDDMVEWSYAQDDSGAEDSE